MNHLILILLILLPATECVTANSSSDNNLALEFKLNVAANTKSTHKLKLPDKVKLVATSGEGIVKTIQLNGSILEITTDKAGIAEYDLMLGDKKVSRLKVISELLLDFTSTKPAMVTGSIRPTPYPEDKLMLVAPEVLVVNANDETVKSSPGLLVKNKVGIYPHNQKSSFPDFESDIKYYGYKENKRAFYFRHEPIIPILQVGRGDNNRGAGIIVINKKFFQHGDDVEYIFEGYCSIRTRTYDPETKNLGISLSTVNGIKAKFKGVICARDFFTIGYSTTGQIFSKPFSIKPGDYLNIAITGEASKGGGDSSRTTRLEYIKITPKKKK